MTDANKTHANKRLQLRRESLRTLSAGNHSALAANIGLGQRTNGDPPSKRNGFQLQSRVLPSFCGASLSVETVMVPAVPNAFCDSRNRNPSGLFVCCHRSKRGEVLPYYALNRCTRLLSSLRLR